MSIHTPFEDKRYEQVEIELSDPIARHVYPRWLTIAIIVTITCSALTTAYFWHYDLPRHCQIHADLIRAENLFESGNYEGAMPFYTSVLERELKCKKAYLRLSQICLTQSAEDDDMYGAALLHLLLSGCTDEQFAEVCTFVPSTRKEHFMALFTPQQEEKLPYDLPDSWRSFVPFDASGRYTA